MTLALKIKRRWQMKLIIVTEMNCFTGKVDIKTSCMANEDDAGRLVGIIKPMAEQMSLGVHCITPDSQHEAIEYLKDKLKEAEEEIEEGTSNEGDPMLAVDIRDDEVESDPTMTRPGGE